MMPRIRREKNRRRVCKTHGQVGYKLAAGEDVNQAHQCAKAAGSDRIQGPPGDFPQDRER